MTRIKQDEIERKQKLRKILEETTEKMVRNKKLRNKIESSEQKESTGYSERKSSSVKRNYEDESKTISNVTSDELYEVIKDIVSSEMSKETAAKKKEQSVKHIKETKNHYPQNEVYVAEFLNKGSCEFGEKYRFSHNINYQKGGVCAFDLKEQGSCRYGERCYWSHQTPRKFRNDPSCIDKHARKYIPERNK